MSERAKRALPSVGALALLVLSGLAGFRLMGLSPPDWLVVIHLLPALAAATWLVCALHKRSIECDHEGVRVKARSGSWTKVAWAEIRQAHWDDQGGLVLRAKGNEYRIALSGRVDGDAVLSKIEGHLLVPIAGRPPPWLSPRLGPDHPDPLPPLAAAGAYRCARLADKERVSIEAFRPRVDLVQWLALVPAFSFTLLRAGWQEALRVLHHGTREVYWKRVVTKLGPTVYRSEGGFTSLDGRWRYRFCAHEGSAFWDELRAETGAVAATYRSNPAPPRALHHAAASWTRSNGSCGRDWYRGLPRWLGGHPELALVVPSEVRLESHPQGYRLIRITRTGQVLGATWHSSRRDATNAFELEHGWTTMPSHVPPDEATRTREISSTWREIFPPPRAGTSRITRVDWGRGPVRNIDELEARVETLVES